MARPRNDILSLSTDPAVRGCLALLFVLALPYVLPGLGTDTRQIYAYYSDVPLHLLVIAIFVMRARSLRRGPERRFWLLLAAGYGSWSLVKVTTFLLRGTRFDDPLGLILEEVFYLLFYLLIASAIELRPDLERPLDSALSRIEVFAGLVFAFGLMAYLVVIPSVLTPATFSSMLPASLLYVTADVYLAIRLWTLRAATENAYFRRVYGWLLLTAWLWLLLDLFDAISAAGFASWIAHGTLLEALWTVPALTAVATARLGWQEAAIGRQDADDAEKRPQPARDPVAELWMGRLAIYAILLPLLHFVIETAGLLEGSTWARAACLVVILAVLSFLALLRDRVFAAERRLLVAERQRVRNQLALSQSMAAVRRLAGGIAHDFNNMLMVVRGHAEWLARELPPSDRMHDRAQQIVAAADRAADLTGQLVRVSRSQPGQRAPFALNETVRKVEAMLRSVVPADVELALELSPQNPVVVAEPAAFDDALVNLVINARDAIEGRGQIVIRTRTATAGEHDDLGLLPGPYGIVEIRDTGSGIDSKILPNIFEPFFSTKEEGRGSGLGLSMVYSYADQNGGGIEVESEPGSGSTFRLWLPWAAEQAQTEAATMEPAAHGRYVGTVLLVDDETQVRRVLAELLHGLGWQVLESSGGEDACQVLGGHQQDIDVLLTDIVMPGMDGGELAEIVHRTYPQIPIVFMTAYAEDGLRRLGGWARSAPVVSKPCSAIDLHGALNRALQTSLPRALSAR